MKPAPSYKNMPSAINPEAVDVWRHTVKRYADSIYSPKNIGPQWARAKMNFERLCRMKGVDPYLRDRHLGSIADRLTDIADRL